jgi:hypothetical protein
MIGSIVEGYIALSSVASMAFLAWGWAHARRNAQ